MKKSIWDCIKSRILIDVKRYIKKIFKTKIKKIHSEEMESTC